MIKTISKSSDKLISRTGALGKRIIAVILALVGVALVAGAFAMEGGAFWAVLGFGALLILVGAGLFLFVSAYTYTFDKSAGTLEVRAASMVSASTQEYPLNDISRLVSWKQVKRHRDNDGDTKRRVTMNYIIEFASGDSITIAKDRRRNFGFISSVINTVRDTGAPEPIQDIADFLGVEVVDETPNPSKVIGKAVNSIMN